MKKYIITLLSISGFAMLSAQGGGRTGINTTTPNTTLTVNGVVGASYPAGIQVPRVKFADLQAKGSIYGVAQTGSLIFVTDFTTQEASGPRAKINSKGYYFFDGTQWNKVLQQSDFNDYFWGTSGNTGLVAPNNSLGTTNAQDLVFKTNATEAMRVVSNADATNSVEAGNVGIGTTKPTEKLDVNGTALFRNGFQNSTITGNEQLYMAKPDATNPFVFRSRHDGSQNFTNGLDLYAWDETLGSATAAPTRRMVSFDSWGTVLHGFNSTSNPNTPITASLVVNDLENSVDPYTNGIRLYNPGTAPGDHNIIGLQTNDTTGGNVGIAYHRGGWNGWHVGVLNSDRDQFAMGANWDTVTGANLAIDPTTDNFGLGVTQPTTKVEVNGETRYGNLRVRLKEVDISTLTTACGTGVAGFTDNLNRSMLFYKGTGTQTVNQLFAKGGKSGDVVYVYNYSNQTIHFADGGGCGDTTATNMITANGTNTVYDLPPYGMAVMYYVGAPLSKWKIAELK